jgi:hypothetical protein
MLDAIARKVENRAVFRGNVSHRLAALAIRVLQARELEHSECFRMFSKR